MADTTPPPGSTNGRDGVSAQYWKPRTGGEWEESILIARNIDRVCRERFQEHVGPIAASVPRIPPPDPETFLQEYVLKNRPCIIQGAIDDWPAVEKWNNEYLCDAIGDDEVRVNFMPANTGSGGISNNYHVDPEARRLRFREFLSALRDHGGNAHLAHRRDGDHHRARRAWRREQKRLKSIITEYAEEADLAADSMATNEADSSDGDAPVDGADDGVRENPVYAEESSEPDDDAPPRVPLEEAVALLAALEEIPLLEARDRLLANPDSEGTEPNCCYISEAGNNLKKRYAAIESDLGELAFAERLGAVVVANIWIGNAASASPMHNDYFENLFVVLAGTKKFRLYHGLDQPFMYATDSYRHGRWKKKGGKWGITDRGRKQVWVAADPTNPDYERHPLFRKATPIDVEVRAGEVLFLPYMWFHQVGQVPDEEGKCIGINYWFDDHPQNKFKDLLRISETLLENFVGEQMVYEGEFNDDDSLFSADSSVSRSGTASHSYSIVSSGSLCTLSSGDGSGGSDGGDDHESASDGNGGPSSSLLAAEGSDQAGDSGGDEGGEGPSDGDAHADEMEVIIAELDNALNLAVDEMRLNRTQGVLGRSAQRYLGLPEVPLEDDEPASDGGESGEGESGDGPAEEP